MATCKPEIRKAACVGDWVIGTGSKKNGLERHIVYAMRVSETLSFNEYWSDSRFLRKRPDMRASISRAFGDNIYHRTNSGEWRQIDSHHSYEDGIPNTANIRRDTKADRVLISDDFVYWGGIGPEIPIFSGHDICKKGQGYKRAFPATVVDGFVDWIRRFNVDGYLGDPYDWQRLSPKQEAIPGSGRSP